MEKIRPRLWVVTDIYWPSETSTGFLLGQLISSLSSSFEVTVVTGRCEEKFRQLDLLNGENLGRQERIVTLPLSYTKSYIKRILNGLVFSLLSSFYIILFKRSNEKVLVVTNPVTNPLFFGFLLGKSSSLLCHDLFPLNLIRLNQGEQFKYSLLGTLYGMAYRRFSLVISLGDDMSLVLKESFNIKSLIKITNWVSHEKAIVSLNKEVSNDVTHILFAGNIGKAQGLLEAIEFLESCSFTKVTLDIVGDGVYRKELLKKIKATNLNVRYLGSKKRLDIITMFSSYNFGLVSLNPAMFGLGVPSKSYDILGTGTPILYLGPPNTEVSKMVLENNLGIVGNINKKGSLTVNDLNKRFNASDIIHYVYSNHGIKSVSKKFVQVLS